MPYSAEDQPDRISRNPAKYSAFVCQVGMGATVGADASTAAAPSSTTAGAASSVVAASEPSDCAATAAGDSAATNATTAIARLGSQENIELSLQCEKPWPVPTSDDQAQDRD